MWLVEIYYNKQRFNVVTFSTIDSLYKYLRDFDSNFSNKNIWYYIVYECEEIEL